MSHVGFQQNQVHALVDLVLDQTRLQSTFTKDVAPTENHPSAIVILCTFEKTTSVNDNQELIRKG